MLISRWSSRVSKLLSRHRYVNSARKAVFITGCDSGIGQEVALHLDKLGFKVFAGCLFPVGEGAKQLKQKASLRLLVIPIDITSDAAVGKAVKAVKTQLKSDETLWAVVNNAGICIMGFFEWYTPSQISRLIDINVVGTIRVLRAFLPLVKQARGRIVTVSSIVTELPFPGTSVYNATKFALEGLSDTLRREPTFDGVRVVVIQPSDHSEHTNITKLQRQFAAEQWAAMSEEQQRKVKPTFDAYHESVTVSKGRSRVKTKEESFAIVLGHMKEAVMATHPKTRYLSAPLGERLAVRFINSLPTHWQDRMLVSFVKRRWNMVV